MSIGTAHMIGAGAVAGPPRASSRGTAAVRAWIVLLAVLVLAMVAVGGATRLTGSGLSITEWKPVTGVVPPLTAEAWETAFAKYREIPQYKLLNAGMSLSEFKAIYWWEWSHRLLGRTLGVVFALPFLWFWARGLLRARLALALLGIGALGALQGAVGWIMVASGLQPGMVAVAPVKLTLHLLLASAILAGLVWLATDLASGRAPDRAAAARPAAVLLALVFLQIALGGLVAGSKAGLTHNTWPLMDGALLPSPSALFVMTPWLDNLVANPTLVQFNHRVVAYLLVGFALWHAWSTARAAPASPEARRAAVLAGLTLAQMALGIATLLLAVPLWAGLAHQLGAMAVLAMATVHLWLARQVPLPHAGERAP